MSFATASPTILARGLSKAYRSGSREVPVLRGVDFVAAPGELVAIVGPSGSGKSTLLHILGTLDAADDGEVVLAGQPVAQLRGEALAAFRNKMIGFIFQFHQLLPDFTALENVMMPGRIAGREPRELAREAAALLASVGLADRQEHFPNQLSGGECQRVALCRALVLKPPILLADEPTGNLDPASGETVFRLFLDLQTQHATTAVLVTHNPELARRCARLFVLENGVLRAENTRSETFGTQPPPSSRTASSDGPA